MNMSVELGPIIGGMDVPNIKLRRARARSQVTDLKTIPESRNLIEQYYCKYQVSIRPSSLPSKSLPLDLKKQN